MSVTIERPRVGRYVGAPLDRIDGRLKVSGEACYAADTPVEHLLHELLGRHALRFRPGFEGRLLVTVQFEGQCRGSPYVSFSG